MAEFKNTVTYTEQQLNDLGLKDLQETFAMATGTTSKAPNKKFLIKGILKAQAAAGNAEAARDTEASREDADDDANLAFGMTTEQRYHASTSNAKSLEAAQDKLNSKTTATPEAQVVTSGGQKDEFAGMSPKQVIEAAKAKGKAKVEQSKHVAAEPQEPAADAPKAKRTKDSPKKESDGLAELDTPALQALYLKEIGRGTGSTNLGYLIWKIREARKGNIKVGPAKERAPKSNRPVKVIPIRIEEDALAAMDELIGEGKPYSSRMDIFRRAIAVWADMAGHVELSSLIVGAAATD